MKSLAKNSVYNILYKCSNLLFPLIISAYVSRILLADGVGKVSAAQNIVTYFTVLAALGLPTYGTKVIAALGENRAARSKAFSELFSINAVSTVLCSLAYYLMVLSVPYFRERAALSVVCGLAILFNIINVDWFYQGREEYGYIMLRNFLIKLLSLVAVFVFVKTVDDYVQYAAVLTLSKVANNLFNVFHLRKEVRFSFSNLNIAQHIKPVLVFLAASVAIEIYTLADTTMLTFIHGDDIVGYYATARKGIDVIRMMIVAICAVFLPRLSYYYANQQLDRFEELVGKGIRILSYVTVPATIGVILTAEYFVPLLFGNGFVDAIDTTRILSFSILTVAFSNFFGYQVLVTVGKERKMLISTIIGAIVNVVLNFVLIFSLKHNGVAIASAVTELCVTVYQFFAIKRCVRIRLRKHFVLTTLLGAALMSLAVVLCKHVIDNAVLCLAVSVIVGATVYVLTTYITKNELSVWAIGRCKALLSRRSKNP